jgi:glycosyltransferase involved in cell wall biosynthesis
MKCSVVIRAYNEGKHLGKLLYGIEQQTYFKHVEVILVDSGSTDDTIKIAEHHNVKIIHILPSEFSFGYALNKGCEAATGEILLFASAHVYPLHTTWIENIVTAFQDPNVGLVYGRQTGNEVTKFSEQQIFNQWFPLNNVVNQNNPFCNNANCAIRKSLWIERPYDEKLTGLEDLAWAVQLKFSGKEITYLADAPIVHVHEETWQKIRHRYEREAYAYKVIFPQEKLSFFTFIRLVVHNIWVDWLSAINQGKWIKSAWEIVRFRYMQFSGTYRGYRDHDLRKDELQRRFYYPQREAHKTDLNNQMDESSRIYY